MSKYDFTPEMGEISGLGGGYEETCRRMLRAGLKWLDDHPKADPKFEHCPQIYGVFSELGKDAEALTAAVTDKSVTGEHGCTGAMHQAVMQSVLWIRANGWEKYVESMSKKHDATDQQKVG